MRRWFLAAAVLAAAGNSLLSTPPAAAATASVAIANKSFKTGDCTLPTGTNALTVTVGDTVTWHNCDPFAHTVAADDHSFDSGDLPGSVGTFSHKFTSVNTTGVAYHCNIHPEMTGTVIVNAPATTTTHAATTTTTAKATTTSSSTSTSTTQTTQDLSGVFDDSTTTSSSSSTTTSTTVPAKSNDGSSSGAIIALLLVAIAGVGAGAYYAFRRMREQP